MQLTVPQIQGIRYYQRLALPPAIRKDVPKIQPPDPRVVLALCDLGLLELSHHDHGPHYRLTDAGSVYQATGIIKISGHVMNGQTVMVVRRTPSATIVQVLKSVANYRKGDNLKFQPSQVVSS
jgi:hypothetical protein